MRTDIDVLVVGAGPTGLVLTHFLALHGISVLLVEQNATTVGEPRAVSIDDESLRTLQQIGLAEAVSADIASGYGSVYLGPDRKPFAVVRPSRSDYGWPKRNAFRQPLLERTLAQALSGKSGIETRFATRYQSHRDAGDHVVVTLEQDGGRREVACRYLVGCDGGRSAIRKAIGATLAGSSFEERWLIVDLDDTNDPLRDTKVFCDPARPCITLPGPNRTRRYEMRLRPEETNEEVEREERARALLAEFGDDAGAPIARARVYTFHARIADHWRRGNVFLAGDAAHLTPPFAGQGMNTGLRDASNLAWKLAAVIDGRLGPGLLDSYQAERRDHAWSMIRLAITMGRVMAPRNALDGALIRAAFHLAAVVPPAREWLAQMRYKPKPRFTDGFFLRRGALSRRLAGTMLPQPRVERGRESLRLDDLLGSGFSLLCYGADPAALARRCEGVVDRLGARIVGCLPRSLAFASTPMDGLVRDDSGTLGALLAEAGAAILLRPDRYVATAITPDDAARDVPSVEKLIASTFATA